ncbi:MAG: cell envelope integrity protein TolA [Deltaproteobacteria bacterium]|nr:cell envelope integrity protein TolA [Deltaproteobacteria bacterium]MBW2137333.1 cell envelope integrity protein TolA [Deltaproteobacteria bacterium]
MVVLSALFHVIVFSMLFFLPESMSKTSRFEGIIYEVDLVELPSRSLSSLERPGGSGKQPAKAIVGKEKKAKRIVLPKKRKPVVIAKKTIERKRTSPEKPRTDPSKLIDQALSKIERKVQRQDRILEQEKRKEAKEEEVLERTISKIEERATAGSRKGTGRGTPSYGIPIQIYQMEVENRIKGNWSYPVALQGSKDLEAVVAVKVKRDGKILDIQFVKRSSNAIFDQSVAKAVERSNPLPPFPEGYLKSYDDIEIRFNLKDLENS